MVDIIPIIANDVIGVNTSWAHRECSDGTMISALIPFVPNVPDTVQCELHFLTMTPEKYIKAAADAGYKRVIAHVEAHDPRLFLDQVKYEDVEVGLALDGSSEFETIEPFLEELDVVHVMTAEAGNTVFLPECIEKVKSIRLYLPDLPISVEGAITQKTARVLEEAGASRLVVDQDVLPALFAAHGTSQSG